jgi:hypothetical protein
MAKKKPAAVDNDPYRLSLARRRKLDHVLNQAQNVIGSEFLGADRPSADRKLGNDLWDALEKFRHQLSRGPR